MTLRLGCRFQLVFLQAWHSTTGHWASSSLAFAMLASPCDSVLATPALPHFASPTCFVHSPVSRSAKSVGLAGLTRYLSYTVLWTKFIPPFHGAPRTASYPTAPAQIPSTSSGQAPACGLRLSCGQSLSCGQVTPGSSEILASAFRPKPSKPPFSSSVVLRSVVAVCRRAR
jgi:hypothetical protein